MTVLETISAKRNEELVEKRGDLAEKRGGYTVKSRVLEDKENMLLSAKEEIFSCTSWHMVWCTIK